MKIAVLTVSDRCSAGEQEDRSGPAIVQYLRDNLRQQSQPITFDTRIVPDDVNAIQDAVVEFCDGDGGGGAESLLVSTGGTGFSPRDVTPEAVLPLLHKQAPGAVHMILQSGLQHTSFAWLSRPVVGVRGSTIVMCLPGSPKAALEGLAPLVQFGLQHAMNLCGGAAEDAHPSSSVAAPPVVSTSSHRSHHTLPPRSVADRARQSAYPLTPVDEALGVILSNVPLPTTVVVSTATVSSTTLLLGAVLSGDVVATFPHPPFRASTMDGYAVVSADGPGTYPVVNALTAGCTHSSSVVMGPGQVCRVSTGGPLPDGADAVVPVEATTLAARCSDGCEERMVNISSAVTSGTFVRQVGCDFAAGACVLKSGTALGAAEIGLLHGMGSRAVSVFRKPVVCVLSTGDELADLHHSSTNKLSSPTVAQSSQPPPGSGKIYDTNKATLIAAITAAGFDARDGGICRDDLSDTGEKFDAALRVADVVVSSGGVSMGEMDCVKAVLEDLGAKVHFARVAMRPAKPTTFATIAERRKVCFALPGNPVSALVALHVFVLPALRRMAGVTNFLAPRLRAELEDDEVKLGIDRPEYRCSIVAFSISRSRLLVRSAAGGQQASHRLVSSCGANGLMVLPIVSEGGSGDGEYLRKGCIVDVILIGQIDMRLD